MLGGGLNTPDLPEDINTHIAMEGRGLHDSGTGR